jgi:dienelactone hydrolase
VLDLARSGTGVRGVAGLRGVLTPPEGGERNALRAMVSVFHGGDDPLAPPADVAAPRLRRHHARLHGAHGRQPEAGIMYSERAARRTWPALGSFLAEALA